MIPPPESASILSRSAVAAALGLCAGIAAAGGFDRATLLLPAGVVCAAVAFSAATLARRVRVQRAIADAEAGAKAPAGATRWPEYVSVMLGLSTIALAGADIGAWRMASTQATAAQAIGNVRALVGVQQIRGLVADDPTPRARTTSLTLSDVLVHTGSSWSPLGAKVLVSVPPNQGQEYGDYLQLRGKLQPLGGTPAAEAEVRQGVLASMAYPRVSYLANPQANPILQGIFRLRHRLADTITRTLPDPAASTLTATILGLRSALPKNEQQALIDTGTIHLVVISGFKLSLIAAALEAVGFWVLRRATTRQSARVAVLLAVLAAIAGYTVMTGATPSAVRAAIMAGVVVLAALAGRPRDQLAALSVAALVILIVNPFELSDGGFRLSCLSVLGIAVLGRPLAVRLGGEGVWRPALGEAAAVSIAATAFDLPVLANSFHIVSLVSPLANLVGMPLLAPIMVLGGLGAVLGSIFAPLGALLLWPAWAVMTLLEQVIHGSDAVPYAALPVPEIPALAIAGYYGVLLFVTWRLQTPAGSERPRRMSRPISWGLIAAGAVASTAAAFTTTRPPAGLRVTFLAVPGVAALIQTPAGRRVLVNGGENGADLMRQVGQLLPPWDRRLDLVVVTSSRQDHVGGLEAVLARYRVSGVVEPRVDRPTLTFSRLQPLVTRRIEPAAIDLGGGATLAPLDAGGWRLTQGAQSVLFDSGAADGDFAAESAIQPAGEALWIVPIMRGLQGGDGALKLADSGSVTLSFSAR